MIRRSFRAVVTPPLLFLAFALLLFEETVWRWAKALGALIARVPFMAALERLVARLDARLVFLLFLIPMALLLPLKFFALWLIATGQPVLGVGVVVVAKMLGTAISARLYTVAEPRLMELRAFAWLHGHVTGWLRAAHAWMDASPAWQAAKRAMRGAKEVLRGWVLRARGMLRLRRGGMALRFAAVKRWMGRG